MSPSSSSTLILLSFLPSSSASSPRSEPRNLAGPGHTDLDRDPSQRNETDFFTGEPLRALSTLVYSDNVDLQRSASLTFAEITERGACGVSWM